MISHLAKCIAPALLAAILFAAGSADAARYSSVIYKVQSMVAAQGHDPGVLDGIFGPNTSRAISAYQASAGLPQTGRADAATLESLSIGVSVGLVNNVQDWRALPTQAEIDQMVAVTNNPSNAYADYRPNAPSGNYDLPGQAILAAMNRLADVYGSRRQGQPGHTAQGYKYASECLKTFYNPDHWSDITVHYYCQMSLPRACYTYALAGRSTGGVKYARPRAYAGCAAGQLDKASDFQIVVREQPLVFQYVMYGQTHAFKHDQEQAIINAFYGVADPNNLTECRTKRPRRKEDPTDGTHCRVQKEMSKKLIGRSS